jgi:hypothetical protein
MVRVTCARCETETAQRRRSDIRPLGQVYDSRLGPLYVPDAEAALRCLEGNLGGRVIKDVKRRQRDLGIPGKVRAATALDIALIVDGKVTLAEPRSSFGDPVTELIAYCTKEHGYRPLTVGLLERAIANYRASSHTAPVLV